MEVEGRIVISNQIGIISGEMMIRDDDDDQKLKQKQPDLIHFEETELRLGLPGGISNIGDHGIINIITTTATTTTIDHNYATFNNSNGKRSGLFDEEEADHRSHHHVDLKLKLNSTKEMDSTTMDPIVHNLVKEIKTPNHVLSCSSDSKPPAKAQVVGWPPVRSFRKNMITAVQKKERREEGEKVNNNENPTFVKVSLDGAPYLRKVDLHMYNGYRELSDALSKMFGSFTIGNCGSQGMKDYMNESKLMDILNGSDYVPTYEDKDGDWMLVGDVPWEMFVGSCKRLRIMKGTEAIGLAPRAMEKCKNRS